MDLLSLLRTLGGLGVVLGILAGALWLVRRYDLRLSGRSVGARERRLELVETLPIDGRRMVALVRRDGREHLVLIAPEGHLILESAVVRDATDAAATQQRRTAQADACALREERRQRRASPDAAPPHTASFAALVDRVRTRTGPTGATFRTIAKRVARSAATVGGRAAAWARAGAKAAAIARENAAALLSAFKAARAEVEARPRGTAPVTTRMPDPSPPPPAPTAPGTAARLPAVSPSVRPPAKRARRRRRFHQETHVA